MTVTLRSASQRALVLASGIRDLAAEVEPSPNEGLEQGTHANAANNLRRIAYDLELSARRMAVRGAAFHEPEPGS